MRYESESQVWSTAARIVRDRVRALPEFQEARATVVAGALAACRGRDVAGMREFGGFSVVLRRLVAALPERYRVNVGSQLLPSTVASELVFEIPKMREEVQAELARRVGR